MPSSVLSSFNYLGRSHTTLIEVPRIRTDGDRGPNLRFLIDAAGICGAQNCLGGKSYVQLEGTSMSIEISSSTNDRSTWGFSMVRQSVHAH